MCGEVTTEGDRGGGGSEGGKEGRDRGRRQRVSWGERRSGRGGRREGKEGDGERGGNKSVNIYIVTGTPFSKP